MRNDNVNHPAHYTNDPSGVECIEITRHRDFNIGNAIKYLWRAGRKEDPTMGKAEKTVEDLSKAIFYIKDEIKLLGGTVEEPKPAIQEASVANAPDGVYLIYKDGTAAAYYPDNKPSADGCVAVGLKMGSKCIAIDLHDFQDEAGNKDITLTTQKGDKDYSGYKDNYLDAGADWDGKDNTEHLKQIGLNPAIKLGVGQWIPALGELKFIQLFRKEVNEALEYAGGDALDPVWYWSSTEFSAAYAWILTFDDGCAYYWSTKAGNQTRVRPVSAFLL